MTAAEIAAALGAAHRSGGWWSCRCPAHDDRSPSLSLRDGDRGLIVRCWAGCDPRDILAELRRRGLPCRRVEDRTAGAVVDRQRRDDSARNVEIARRIWGEARDTRGTPVERYLAGRGITVPVPPTLRYAPSLRRPDGSAAPAMVGRIDGPDGKLIGIHRTWLYRGPDGAWRRRERAMLGRTARGAVRLAPAGETILIGEGIETCLAGMRATALPGWAALSTSGMTALILPPQVRYVIVCADHDRSGAGARAARVAERRWRAEGRRVTIYMSPRVGEDAADLILAAAAACRAA
jgi:hypothetical protein